MPQQCHENATTMPSCVCAQRGRKSENTVNHATDYSEIHVIRCNERSLINVVYITRVRQVT